MEVLIIFWLMCGALAAMIASSKGGSGLVGFIVGALFGPFGIAFAFFLGGDDGKDAKAIADGAAKKCPKCAELVKSEAVICKHCGVSLA
jgi:hypothetical protein